MTPQKATPNNVNGRDLFQTPDYATKLLVPYIPTYVAKIWECACGEGKMADVFDNSGYTTIRTDLLTGHNFLDYEPVADWETLAIVTNPPFSLKRKFYERCKSFEVPFALLIPADYCGWLIDAVRYDGCEKIIPNRRIDFITPNKVLNSSAYYHSMWLTWGFGLDQTETFVELTKSMKEDV